MVDNTNTTFQEHKFYISSKLKPEIRIEVPQALFLAISGNIHTEINYDQETNSYTSLFLSNDGDGISCYTDIIKLLDEFKKSQKTKSATCNKKRYFMYAQMATHIKNNFRVSENEFVILKFILDNCVQDFSFELFQICDSVQGENSFYHLDDSLSNADFHQHFLEYYNEEKFKEFKKSPNDFYRSELSRQNSIALRQAFSKNKKKNSKSLFGTIIDFILNLIKSFFSKAASLFKGIFSFFSSSQSMKETPTTLQKPLEKSPITHKPEIQEFTSQQQQPQQPQQPTTSPKLTKNS